MEIEREQEIKKGLNVLYGKEKVGVFFDEFLKKEGILKQAKKTIEECRQRVIAYVRFPRKLKKQMKKEGKL